MESAAVARAWRGGGGANTCRTTTGARCVAERCATRAAGSTYDDAVATSERSRSKRDMAAVRFRKSTPSEVGWEFLVSWGRWPTAWPPIRAPPSNQMHG